MFRILGNKSGYSLLASVFQCHKRRTHQRRDQSFRSISAIFYIVNVPEWAQAQRITALSVAFIGDRETGCAPAHHDRCRSMLSQAETIYHDARNPALAASERRRWARLQVASLALASLGGIILIAALVYATMLRS